MTRAVAHSKPGDRKGVCVVPLEKGLPMKRHKGTQWGRRGYVDTQPLL